MEANGGHIGDYVPRALLKAEVSHAIALLEGPVCQVVTEDTLACR